MGEEGEDAYQQRPLFWRPRLTPPHLPLARDLSDMSGPLWTLLRSARGPAPIPRPPHAGGPRRVSLSLPPTEGSHLMHGHAPPQQQPALSDGLGQGTKARTPGLLLGHHERATQPWSSPRARPRSASLPAQSCPICLLTNAVPRSIPCPRQTSCVQIVQSPSLFPGKLT